MEANQRAATTTKQNLIEGGSLASVGGFIAAVYARFVPEASIEEVAALAAFLPALLNTLLHMRRNKKANGEG